MLHKYNDPKNIDFLLLSGTIQEFAEKADQVLKRRGKFMNNPQMKF
jgi:hypothetical protein